MTEVWDYAADREFADEMIAEVGQSATLKKRTASGAAYNPTVAYADHACTIADMTHVGKMSDGTRIEAGESLLYLAKDMLAVEPTASDRIAFGGQTLQIVKTLPLAPGGIVVFYEIQARR